MKSSNDYNNKLSATIRKLRKLAALSQQDLAGRAGISRNTLVDLEGGGNPSFSTITRVLEALGKIELLNGVLREKEPIKVAIINGPNLNLIGKREPDIYGNIDLYSYFEELKRDYLQLELLFFQSNIEGELINYIHNCSESLDYLFLNAGAYTHTSLAIADAVKAIDTPTLELHISNVMDREKMRHISLISRNCAGIISGFGLSVYKLACEYVLLQD